MLSERGKIQPRIMTTTKIVVGFFNGSRSNKIILHKKEEEESGSGSLFLLFVQKLYTF